MDDVLTLPATGQAAQEREMRNVKRRVADVTAPILS